MRITIVQGAFFPVPPIMGGAVEKVWFGLGQELARRGHSVLHLSRRHPQLPDTETIAGVQHLRVSGFKQPRSLALLKLKDLLFSLAARRHLPEADILVTNSFWLPMLVRSARPGRLCVNVNRFPRGQMRFYLHAARLQAVSGVIREAIVEQTPAAAGITALLPNPLPADFAVPATPPDKPVGRDEFLFVGRIHPEKGLDLLVTAFGEYLRTAPRPARLRIVGPAAPELGGAGPAFLGRMQQLAAACGPAIEWLGPVFDSAELRALYASSHFLVYPSTAAQGEASPVTPVEAMAGACVPIVSNLRCFDDYVADGRNAFVFGLAGSPAAQLAATMARAAAAPLPALQAAALATARDYTVQRVCDRYEADFRSLCALPR
ncbi:MAG: glycosyltransferase family 4 protein [Opitutaceae bacterium]|nr:glycosyltransferase family 4 protein [Opitutaceae bacterium]